MFAESFEGIRGEWGEKSSDGDQSEIKIYERSQRKSEKRI